jgi:hypothetical protein
VVLPQGNVALGNFVGRQKRVPADLGSLMITTPPRINEHSEQARAPHTNGLRDVPRYGALSLQGVFYPNKISGVGTKFGLLIHILPGPTKQRACKSSIVLN